MSLTDLNIEHGHDERDASSVEDIELNVVDNDEQQISMARPRRHIRRPTE